jgi:DNA-binding ferritin-like protein
MKTRKNTLDPTLNKMLEMLLIIKMYHWKTPKYSAHMATDELYESFNKNMDTFVEIWLGKNGKRIRGNVDVSIKYYSNKTKFIKKIKSLIHHLDDLQVGPDLLSVKDDIVGDLNKFIYLLSFH